MDFQYIRTDLANHIYTITLNREDKMNALNATLLQEIKKAIEIAEGNKEAKLVLDAMAYQIAKEIGAMATVLKGKADAIILTGGVAFDKQFCRSIKERVSFVAKVIIYPGEQEMQALAQGGYDAVKKLVQILKYQ